MYEEGSGNRPQAIKPSQFQDGFSSQEEEQEIIYTGPNMSVDFHSCIDQRVRMKMQMQPLRQIATKNYSLQPDMANGWAPKLKLLKPVPLTFRNYQFDCMIDYGLKSRKLNGTHPNSGQPNILLCYMGARYDTTYYAWYDKQFEFPYKHLSAPKNIKITDRFLVGQHWDAVSQNVLLFDSLFESGNLDCAIKVSDNEYDLFIRVDSNTKGHLQWYNFKVKNAIPRKNYKINICNFQKGKSLYSRGMRPFCFSVKSFQNQKIGWHQIQGEIKYKRRMSRTSRILQCENTQNFYQLSFNFSTQYQQDEIQFSYCVPYTYTKLRKYLTSLTQKHSHKNMISFGKLCSSLGGQTVDQITITQNVSEEQKSYKERQRLNKKVIFITGRCHPGETNGSWMVQGLIDFLCGDSAIAILLRMCVIFKIVPMLNPDGVIIGNYRTGLFGKDFNREFNSPDKDIFPQIYHLKQMFWGYKEVYKQNLLFYLDFHGHSIKKNVFAYGPEYQISHKNYYDARMIVKLISIKTNMFRYHSCIYKISESKLNTGRAVFLNQFKIPFTFTIQASNGSYYDHQSKTNIDFDENKWMQVGAKIIEGVYEYLKIYIQFEKIREQKIQERKINFMKNRVKSKVKKNSDRAGYSTSMDFRKCKTVQNESMEQKQGLSSLSLFSLNQMLGSLQQAQKTDQYTSIFEQIKKQESKQVKSQQKNHQSDDDISEGSSDSEGSKDDLDQDTLKSLMLSIKQKKIKSKNKSKNLNNNTKNKTPNSNRQLKAFYQINQQSLNNFQQKNQNLGQKMSQKDMKTRKNFWKKKSCVFASMSPKKEEGVSKAAKIINFSFSLNSGSFNKNNFATNSLNLQSLNQGQGQYQNESINPSRMQAVRENTGGSFSFNQNEDKIKRLQQFFQPQLQLKKIKGRSIQYSQNFKKTFLSVQKQMLRRDSNKRYLVIMNNNNNKSRPNPNYIVENKKVVKTNVLDNFDQSPEKINNSNLTQNSIYSSKGFKSETFGINKKCSINSNSPDKRKKQKQKKQNLLINQRQAQLYQQKKFQQ